MSRLPDIDHRCQHTDAAGRRCRLPRANDHPSLCLRHSRHQSCAEGPDPERVAAELLSSIQDFTTAAAVNRVLANLFLQLARKRIPSRNAAILAYICQLLLNSLREVKEEILDAEDPHCDPALARAIKDQFRRSNPAAFARAIAQRALPPDDPKGSPRARAATRPPEP